MPTGTATLNFGAFPGSSHATVNVTGQTGILATSLVEAWAMGSTADHSEDEHRVETLRVVAGDIVAGTGFTIHGFNTSQLNEPVNPPRSPPYTAGWTGSNPSIGGGQGTRLYGQWKVAWAWN